MEHGPSKRKALTLPSAQRYPVLVQHRVQPIGQPRDDPVGLGEAQGTPQRAWIALTIAQETPVLLLDEPTTFLDMGHQLEVLYLVTGTLLCLPYADVWVRAARALQFEARGLSPGEPSTAGSSC